MKTQPTPIPNWIPVTDRVPDTPRVVIATDLEGQWMAIFEAYGEWFNAESEEPFDSVITHWVEQLPLPEES